MDYIYILQAGVFYKIGIARDVGDRIKSLQTGCPATIKEVFSRQVPEAKKVERYLHNSCRDWHTSGEWFNFGNEEDNALEFLKDQIIKSQRFFDMNAEDDEYMKKFYNGEHPWQNCKGKEKK